MGGTGGSVSRRLLKWWKVKERGSLTSVLGPMADSTRVEKLIPPSLFGVPKVPLRRLLSVLARGRAGFKGVGPAGLGVGGLTGPMSRGREIALPLELVDALCSRVSACFFIGTRFAVNEAFADKCVLTRAPALDGVMLGRCLLCPSVLSGPKERRLDAVVGDMKLVCLEFFI